MGFYQGLLALRNEGVTIVYYYAEEKVKANLKRNTCPKCGRIYFIKIASDGSIVEPCPVCLGLFRNNQ